jgi:hypothetical protein
MLLLMLPHLYGVTTLTVAAGMLRLEVATSCNTCTISVLRTLANPVSEASWRLFAVNQDVAKRQL